MPQLYYDTNSAAPLHALPRRVKTDKNRPVDPDKPEAVGILRLVPATPPKGFQIVASHGELVDGQWREVIDKTKSLADVKAEQLAGGKAESVAANRAECQRRIEARWPSWAQANFALGIYTDPAALADCHAWIANHIEAENAAAAKINAAETPEAAKAVTVEWPNA
jgi:hypothetical protein